MSIPTHMSAIVAETTGGPDVLHLARVPMPQTGSGDVLIRVAGAGINAP